jgi:hypothetical protein
MLHETKGVFGCFVAVVARFVFFRSGLSRGADSVVANVWIQSQTLRLQSSREGVGPKNAFRYQPREASPFPTIKGTARCQAGFYLK